jgi:hypothetical protein
MTPLDLLVFRCSQLVVQTEMKVEPTTAILTEIHPILKSPLVESLDLYVVILSLDELSLRMASSRFPTVPPMRTTPIMASPTVDVIAPASESTTN